MMFSAFCFVFVFVFERSEKKKKKKKYHNKNKTSNITHSTEGGERDEEDIIFKSYYTCIRYGVYVYPLTLLSRTEETYTQRPKAKKKSI
jgi:hypothetical protein